MTKPKDLSFFCKGDFPEFAGKEIDLYLVPTLRARYKRVVALSKALEKAVTALAREGSHVFQTASPNFKGMGTIASVAEQGLTFQGLACSEQVTALARMAHTYCQLAEICNNPRHIRRDPVDRLGVFQIGDFPPRAVVVERDGAFFNVNLPELDVTRAEVSNLQLRKLTVSRIDNETRAQVQAAVDKYIAAGQ